MPIRDYLILLLLGGSLTACGQKGPLTHSPAAVEKLQRLRSGRVAEQVQAKEDGGTAEPDTSILEETDDTRSSDEKQTDIEENVPAPDAENQ
ncbi:MAG: lipoprotein [Gammaproteobacteria bacterium]|nr:lipoprotein [Gammaproteobacteria bacterium]